MDYIALYELLENLIADLQQTEELNESRNYKKVIALSACYELQDFTANKIAELGLEWSE